MGRRKVCGVKGSAPKRSAAAWTYTARIRPDVRYQDREPDHAWITLCDLHRTGISRTTGDWCAAKKHTL